MIEIKPWTKPAIIVLLLILAFVFRWDHTAKQELGGGVIKWKTDRWTGQGWVEIYSGSSAKTKPTSKPLIPVSNKAATVIWFILLASSSVVLVRSIKKEREEPPVS